MDVFIMDLDDVVAWLHAERLLGTYEKLLLDDYAYLVGLLGPPASSAELLLASLPMTDWPLIKDGICAPIVCVQKSPPVTSDGASNTGRISRADFPCC